jgi:predicted ATPase
MKYLESFYLPSFESESAYEYPTKYPIGMFSKRDFYDIHFSNITIFYGGNGSGKSTLLNIINSKLGFSRKSSFYADDAFDVYVSKCKLALANGDDGRELKIPENSKIISSEDIINFILDVRNKNNKTEMLKKELEKEYLDAKYSSYKFGGLDDYDKLVKKVESQKSTKTEYINKRTTILRQFSNGESVLRYFDMELENDGLYLLDEPENSLSPKFQIELLKLIAQSAKYCDCQFIIATHSPFLLSIPGAKIYNLDLDVVDVCDWTKLENVRLYYEFFKSHEDEFK